MVCFRVFVLEKMTSAVKQIVLCVICYFIWRESKFIYEGEVFMRAFLF